MLVNVTVERRKCFDCDSKSHYFWHSSISHDDVPNDKTSVDQCSLHGCANVSLWLRVGNPISAFQRDKRCFTKDEH